MTFQILRSHCFHSPCSIVLLLMVIIISGRDAQDSTTVLVKLPPESQSLEENGLKNETDLLDTGQSGLIAKNRSDNFPVTPSTQSNPSSDTESHDGNDTVGISLSSEKNNIIDPTGTNDLRMVLNEDIETNEMNTNETNTNETKTNENVTAGLFVPIASPKTDFGNNISSKAESLTHMDINQSNNARGGVPIKELNRPEKDLNVNKSKSSLKAEIVSQLVQSGRSNDTEDLNSGQNRTVQVGSSDVVNESPEAASGVQEQVNPSSDLITTLTSNIRGKKEPLTGRTSDHPKSYILDFGHQWKPKMPEDRPKIDILLRYIPEKLRPDDPYEGLSLSPEQVHPPFPVKHLHLQEPAYQSHSNSVGAIKRKFTPSFDNIEVPLHVEPVDPKDVQPKLAISNGSVFSVAELPSKETPDYINQMVQAIPNLLGIPVSPANVTFLKEESVLANGTFRESEKPSNSHNASTGSTFSSDSDSHNANSTLTLESDIDVSGNITSNSHNANSTFSSESEYDSHNASSTFTLESDTNSTNNTTFDLQRMNSGTGNLSDSKINSSSLIVDNLFPMTTPKPELQISDFRNLNTTFSDVKTIDRNETSTLNSEEGNTSAVVTDDQTGPSIHVNGTSSAESNIWGRKVNSKLSFAEFLKNRKNKSKTSKSRKRTIKHQWTHKKPTVTMRKIKIFLRNQGRSDSIWERNFLFRFLSKLRKGIPFSLEKLNKAIKTTPPPTTTPPIIITLDETSIFGRMFLKRKKEIGNVTTVVPFKPAVRKMITSTIPSTTFTMEPETVDPKRMLKITLSRPNDTDHGSIGVPRFQFAIRQPTTTPYNIIDTEFFRAVMRVLSERDWK